LDYKLLKKVMKLGDAQVLNAFCTALDTELHKVHVYMRHQQEELKEEVPLMLPVPEEPPVFSPPGRRSSRFRPTAHVTMDNGINVVRKIESFRHYSDLNIEAMRKILKKFDKRFHCRFHEVIGLPSTAEQLVTAQDISQHLLEPAQECLKQIRHLSYGASLVEHPERPLLRLRQFTFWVRVLQNGVQLLGLHISGPGEDLTTCVKNTFIEIGETGESPLRRSRAHSWCGTRVQVVLPIEDGFGQHLDEDEEVRSLSHVSSPGSFDISQHGGSYQSSGSHSQGSAGSPDSQVRQRASRGSKGQPSAGSQVTGAHGSNHRWWMDVSDTCALSGFPIASLPYPPFKLQVGQGRGHAFVDGQYLLLHVLSTLNFEVLGRALAQTEIQALDQHIKKCKLSPLRLSFALELLCQAGQNVPGARQELAELRKKASKKLGTLRHIQRVRMQRDCTAPAPPGRVQAQQQPKGKGRPGKASKSTRN